MPLPCCRRIQVGRKEERVRHSGAHDPHGCVLPLPCSGMPVFTMPRVVLGRKAHMAACGSMLTPRITAPFSVLEACLFPKVPSEHVANEKRSMGPACGINGDLKTKHVRVACLGAHACACRMIPSPRWRSMPQEPWTTMSVLERFLYLSKPRRHTPQSRSQRSHLQRNRVNSKVLLLHRKLRPRHPSESGSLVLPHCPSAICPSQGRSLPSTPPRNAPTRLGCGPSRPLTSP